MTNIYSPMKIHSCCGIANVRMTKLHESAVVPNKANKDDAGFDLSSIEDKVVPARGRVMVKTGIAMAIPSGYAGLIWPRSGLAVKKGLDVLAGVVDSGYRGEVCVVLQNHTDEDYSISAGDRIAQILIQKSDHFSITVVDSLEDSERGTGGFGSSGS